MSVEVWMSDYLAKLAGALHGADVSQIARAAGVLAKARDEGKRIFVCGNGGSSATASHFCVDLCKGAGLGKEKPFRCLSLGDCLPLTTALGNDIGYEEVFREAMRPFAEGGDVLVCLSVSGNSPNVLRAAELARERGMTVIALCGEGGKLAALADLAIRVADTHFGRVEDVHLVICHLLAYAFMEGVAG